MEHNWICVWFFWPTMQLCRIVYHKNTNKNSWLVHQKGMWVLWGGPKADFLTNLPRYAKPTPLLKHNWVSSSYFDHNRNYVGLYILRILIKINISSSRRCMSPGRRIQGGFLDRPCHILQSRPPFSEAKLSILGVILTKNATMENCTS